MIGGLRSVQLFRVSVDLEQRRRLEPAVYSRVVTEVRAKAVAGSSRS